MRIRRPASTPEEDKLQRISEQIWQRERTLRQTSDHHQRGQLQDEISDLQDLWSECSQQITDD